MFNYSKHRTKSTFNVKDVRLLGTYSYLLSKIQIHGCVTDSDSIFRRTILGYYAEGMHAYF